SATVVLPSATAATTALPTLMPTPAAPPTPSRTMVPVGLPGAGTAYIPILMYHYVRTADQTNDPAGYRLSVTTEHLEQQLDCLESGGYTAVGMVSVACCPGGDQSAPERAVAVTFDDG